MFRRGIGKEMFAALAFISFSLFFSGGSARAWTDTLTPGSTPIRVVYLTELRTAVDDKRYDFGFSSGTWTDPVITAGSTLVRKPYLDELRDKLDDINSAYTAACVSTVPAVPSWDPVTAGVTPVRAVYFTQLRTAADNIGTARACCGSCRKGAGAGGCADQADGADLWADCSPFQCSNTGNCNGSGSCKVVPADADPNAFCSDAATCMTGNCDGAGACKPVVNGNSGNNCTAGATVCSGADTCNGAGGCLANDFDATTVCDSGQDGGAGGPPCFISWGFWQYKCDGAGGCNQLECL